MTPPRVLRCSGASGDCRTFNLPVASKFSGLLLVHLLKREPGSPPRTSAQQMGLRLLAAVCCLGASVQAGLIRPAETSVGAGPPIEHRRQLAEGGLGACAESTRPLVLRVRPAQYDHAVLDFTGAPPARRFLFQMHCSVDTALSRRSHLLGVAGGYADNLTCGWQLGCGGGGRTAELL